MCGESGREREREKWPRIRKGLKGNEGERKTERVVPLAANEYLINLLAWMYLISRRREGTRALKGPAKSRGSSYHDASVNPYSPRRTNISCASAPLTLSSASSYSVSFLAHFRPLAFFSRHAEGNHECEEKGAVTTGIAKYVANSLAFQRNFHIYILLCDIIEDIIANKIII